MSLLTRTLVKLPRQADQTVLSFPFLHLLLRQAEREIFLVADPGNSILLSGFEGLRFASGRLFEIPLNKKTILGAHHYLMNNHEIFNIDEYFDLESSLSSMSLGVTSKASLRVGFEKGLIGKLLYQKKVRWQKELPLDQSYVRLLTEGLGVSDREAYLEVISGDRPEPLTRYVFVALKGLFDAKIRDLYANFFNGLERTSLIFWELDGELSGQFYELLHPNLEYKIVRSSELSEVRAILRTSVGLITNQSWMGWLGVYWGMRSVCLNEEFGQSRYFDLHPESVRFEEEGTDEALDFVCQYLKL